MYINTLKYNGKILLFYPIRHDCDCWSGDQRMARGAMPFPAVAANFRNWRLNSKWNWTWKRTGTGKWVHWGKVPCRHVVLLPVCVRVRRQTFEMREQLRRTTNVASRVRRLSINKSFEHKLCRRGTATVSKNLTTKKRKKVCYFFKLLTRTSTQRQCQYQSSSQTNLSSSRIWIHRNRKEEAERRVIGLVSLS